MMKHPENHIPHDERENRTNEIRILFNALGWKLDYIHTDLIVKALNLYEKMGKKMGIRETSKLQSDWEKHWETYFETKSEQKPDD